jgi:hypothetical protein
LSQALPTLFDPSQTSLISNNLHKSSEDQDEEDNQDIDEEIDVDGEINKFLLNFLSPNTQHKVLILTISLTILSIKSLLLTFSMITLA